MSNLPSLIRQAIADRGLSYRAIAARAEDEGYVLSFSTVSTYASGKTRSYTREKLEAIAVGLGMDKSAFTEAAAMPQLGEPFELPAEAALLEPHERAAVRSVVAAFIQNKQRQDEEVVEDEDDSAPMNDELAQRRQQDDPADHAELYGLAAHPEQHGIAHDELPSEDP
ncbi:hypothetical protein [Nesterenkonia suensis]